MEGPKEHSAAKREEKKCRLTLLMIRRTLDYNDKFIFNVDCLIIIMEIIIYKLRT